MLVDNMNATKSGDEATRGFKPSGIPMPLAVRLTGKFKTAFPDGLTEKDKPIAGTPALRQAIERERREAEDRGGRIAARAGDEVRAGDLLAVELGQPVDRVAEEVGRAVLAVPLGVGAGVAQAEVRAQVDDLHPALVQLGDGRRAGAVRVGDDRGVDVAVAVDGEVVPRSRWADHALAEGQRVEVLQAVQGG